MLLLAGFPACGGESAAFPQPDAGSHPRPEENSRVIEFAREGSHVPMTAEQMERLAGQAAAASGLEGARALEQDEKLYQAWVQTPLRELGGQSPRGYAAGLDESDLLQLFDESAAERESAPARLWMDEVVERLQRELQQAGSEAATDLEALPLLTAMTDRAMAQPESELANVGIAVAALMALGRVGAPQVVPWLLAGLATDDPTIRQAAATSLGLVGAVALPEIAAALRRTRDPYLKEGLYAALGHMPPGPEVRQAIQKLWQEAAGPEQVWLARAIGQLGDPALAPLVAAALAAGPTTRSAYAAFAAALSRMGAERPRVPVPPPQPSDPEGDLLVGIQTLAEAGVRDLGREWAQEAVDRLARTEQAAPEEMDWFVYEQIQRLADDPLERPAEAALARYLDYCYGALQYYGVLSLEHLIAAVSLAGLMAPPNAGDLWQALKADPRFQLHSGRIVALPEVENVEEILDHRDDLEIGPAMVPLRAMALAARGLAHLAWEGEEAEAAEGLLHLLPEGLASPERVAQLQRAMRGQGEALDAFRYWLGQALEQGMGPGEELHKAMVRLWNQTARWELFGHSPALAQQILDLQRAQEGRDGDEEEGQE